MVTCHYHVNPNRKAFHSSYIVCQKLKKQQFYCENLSEDIPG